MCFDWLCTLNQQAFIFITLIAGNQTINFIFVNLSLDIFKIET